MSTEQMRSEFEVEFAKKHGIPVRWVSDCRDGEQEYENRPQLELDISDAWYWWQASRSALVVDLPCGVGGGIYEGMVSHRNVVSRVRAAGITVRDE